ncbi:Arylsulfatase J [Nymphon striatum]|nr:Arylsulfatase J [Nymphon striatum]
MSVPFFLTLATVLAFNVGETFGVKRPHIILIVADDLGWNDVSFHGSPQIPTPNIDALARDGIILNNYYIQPICTPSRSALMTGVHPIHTGMQGHVIIGPEPYGLPLHFKLLPEHLEKLGYRRHMVGKWHLGFFKKEYTPLFRGFESHFGYWCGHQDYYDHTSEESIYWGYDMRENMSVAWDAFGKYSTELYTDHALKLINNHNTDEPFFLYLPHLAVHSANSYSPLQAPEKYTSRFPWIKDENRRTFAGMMSALDDGVGEVVKALRDKGMLQDSIILFTSDNGGPAAGFDMNHASNWPLRGVKATLWEGGVRGAGFIWSPFLSKASRISQQLMKIEDWLPTLYAAAGGDVKDLGTIDGINMWKTLSNDLPSPQKEILHNIYPGGHTFAIRSGDFKLVNGTTYGKAWNGWYGPSGRGHSHTTVLKQIKNSDVAKSLLSINRTTWSKEKSLKSASISCGPVPKKQNCFAWKGSCLFNIKNDPCEYYNLADKYPDIVKKLMERIIEYQKTAVPSGKKPSDPDANPTLHGGAWVSWKD